MGVCVCVCVCVCVFTSVLAAAGFLVALTLAVRFMGTFSTTSSSECSVLASDWSELCWDDASSAGSVDADEKERAVDFRAKRYRSLREIGKLCGSGSLTISLNCHFVSLHYSV